MNANAETIATLRAEVTRTGDIVNAADGLATVTESNAYLNAIAALEEATGMSYNDIIAADNAAAAAERVALNADALEAFTRKMAIVAAAYGESAPDVAEAFEEALAARVAGTDDDGFNVWVSTFGLYNAGNLAGYWVAAEHAPTEVPAFVAGLMLRGIAFDPRDVGEEMHCFDTESAPESGEMSPGRARELAELLEGIDAGAEVLAAWLANGNDLDDDTAEQLEEAYAGTFENLESYAWDFLQDCGMIAELPEWAQVYAGTLSDALANDMRVGGDVWTANVADGVAIFRNI